MHHEVYRTVDRKLQNTFEIREEVVAPTSADDAGPLWKVKS